MAIFVNKTMDCVLTTQIFSAQAATHTAKSSVLHHPHVIHSKKFTVGGGITRVSSLPKVKPCSFSARCMWIV